MVQTRRRRLLAVVLVALAGLALASCGGAGPRARPPTVVVSLDFIPNAVHAPIYMAVANGRDRAHGVRLEIRKLGPRLAQAVASGRVDLGVLDIHDLADARRRGADLVAIGALVRRPLAALIAQPDIHRPRDLQGRTVGVSGLPSDPAFLRAILEHDGAHYHAVRQVTIGFSAVSRLLTHRVDAVPAFWNAEGVTLRRRELAVREFRIDDYGAPPYPEVVFITARRTQNTHRDRLKRTLQAIADGEHDTLANPGTAARLIGRAAETSDIGLIRAQLHAVSPIFAPGLRLDRPVLEQWANFDTHIGIVDRRPDIDRAFDLRMAPG